MPGPGQPMMWMAMSCTKTSTRRVSVVVSSTSPKGGAANDIMVQIYLRAGTDKRMLQADRYLVSGCWAEVRHGTIGIGVFVIGSADNRGGFLNEGVRRRENEIRVGGGQCWSVLV